MRGKGPEEDETARAKCTAVMEQQIADLMLENARLKEEKKLWAQGQQPVAGGEEER